MGQALAQDATGGTAEDVGFAVRCLTGGLVSLDRFKAALLRIIERADAETIPPCVFDMLDLRDRYDLTREVTIPREIRFPAFMTELRDDALIGLLHTLEPARGNISNISTTRAAQALAACPEIRTRYTDLFGERG